METTAHIPSFDMSKYLGGTPIVIGKTLHVLPVANRDNQPYMSSRLPDDALVCRGGTCQPDNFSGGSGVTTDSEGKLNGVSVNSAAGKTAKELTAGVRNNQVGVTTVGEVRKAGGDVVPSGRVGNETHATLKGISKETASKLFTPTQPNENIQRRPR